MKLVYGTGGERTKFTHTGAYEGGMDQTHGLVMAGMPKLNQQLGNNGEFVSPDIQRKILPEIVRPISQRAIGPRGV